MIRETDTQLFAGVRRNRAPEKKPVRYHRSLVFFFVFFYLFFVFRSPCFFVLFFFWLCPLDPVVPSVQDGVRTTKDETVSSLDGTDCLGAVLDGVDGRRLQTREIAQ